MWAQKARNHRTTSLALPLTPPPPRTGNPRGMKVPPRKSPRDNSAPLQLPLLGYVTEYYFLLSQASVKRRIVTSGKGVNSIAPQAVPGSFLAVSDWLTWSSSPSVLQMAAGHRHAQVPFRACVRQSCSKGTGPQRALTTKNSSGKPPLSGFQGDCLGVLPTCPPSGS